MAKLFKGCGTALVTPFRTDGSVDYEAYAALVDRQVAGGVDFLVPLATTGETPTLSPEEKVRLLDITREHAAGLPLLVGAGSNSIPGTIANMQLLEGHGADAWLIVVPFYNKPNQEGQYQYFREIARRSALPIVIYNVPGRTGANMTAGTCIRIASDCPNVVAVKEASGKMDQVVEILQGARAAGLSDRFAVLSGDDDMTLDMMKNGADGVISVASNIAPSKVAAMVREASEAYREAGSVAAEGAGVAAGTGGSVAAAGAGVAAGGGCSVAAAGAGGDGSVAAAGAGVAAGGGCSVAAAGAGDGCSVAAAGAGVAAGGGCSVAAAGAGDGCSVAAAIAGAGGSGADCESVWAAAEALDAPLQPLYKACFVEPNPIPAKSALSLLGLCTDAMRLPLVPATDQTRELMRSVLADLGSKI